MHPGEDASDLNHDGTDLLSLIREVSLFSLEINNKNLRSDEEALIDSMAGLNIQLIGQALFRVSVSLMRVSSKLENWQNKQIARLLGKKCADIGVSISLKHSA